jgi:hypothetical protein
MPGFDRTGPAGMGARTGGGRGFCPLPEYNSQRFGTGRGGRPCGGGRGRAWGGGRGRRFAYISQQEPQVYREYVPQEVENEKEYLEKQTNSLENQVAYLHEQIKELNKRLDELKKTE